MSAMDSGSRSDRPPRVRGSCITALETACKSGYSQVLGKLDGGRSMKGGKTERIKSSAISVAAALYVAQKVGFNVRKV